MPNWVHSAPEDHKSESRSGRHCARGERCPGYWPDDTGQLQAAYAEGGPFCKRDYLYTSRCLADLPERYVLLRAAIGDKRRQAADRVSGSRTPPVPLRLDVDALIRDMVLVLCSLEERVRTAAALTPMDTAASRHRRDEVAIPAAVTVLSAHFDKLLGLAPATVTRIRSIRAAADAPAGTAGRVHPVAGFAELLVDVDGPAAGLEIIHLHYRSRSLVGATRPAPEKLDGVPCRRCQVLSLERAAPSRTRTGVDYWSECCECGQLMSREEYLAWVKMYAAWVKTQQTAPLLEAC